MKNVKIISFIIAVIMTLSAVPVLAVDPCETHTFGDWVTVTEAGCLTEGAKTRTCTVCGYVENDVIPAKGHNNVFDRIAPTCTEPGKLTSYCPTCGLIHSETVIPATGHTAGYKTVVTAPSAGDDGEWRICCVNCGVVLQSGTIDASAPTVALDFSEPEKLDDTYNTVSASVNLINNPGVWAFSFYLYYDPAFFVTDIAVGDIFTSGESIYEAKNIVVSEDAKARSEFAKANIPTSNLRALCFYGDSSDLSDKAGDGAVITVTFRYSGELDGTYGFGFVPVPDSVINAAGCDVDFTFYPASIPFEPIADNVVIGDVNDDGLITLQDLSALKGFLAGVSNAHANVLNSDISGDGLVTISDIGAIKKLLA